MAPNLMLIIPHVINCAIVILKNYESFASAAIYGYRIYITFDKVSNITFAAQPKIDATLCVVLFLCTSQPANERQRELGLNWIR